MSTITIKNNHFNRFLLGFWQTEPPGVPLSPASIEGGHWQHSRRNYLNRKKDFEYLLINGTKQDRIEEQNSHFDWW